MLTTAEKTELSEADQNPLAWAQRVKPVCLVLKAAWPAYLEKYPYGGGVGFLVWLTSGCWTESGDSMNSSWEEIRTMLAARYVLTAIARINRAKRGEKE